MKIDHQSYGIPQNIGFLRIKPISKSDFKGTPPQNTWFLAHIYWAVNYQIFNNKNSRPLVKTTVNILGKSWINCQDLKLLKHEYGHYLIGCLCALAFQKRVNFELKMENSQKFNSNCSKILQDCIKFYCSKQRLYDLQTYHYLNQQNQAQWQKKIQQEMILFSQFFQKNKPIEKLQLIIPNTVPKQIDQNVLKRINERNVTEKKPVLRNQSYTMKSKQQLKKIVNKRTSVVYQINLYKAMQNFPKEKQTLDKKCAFKIRPFSKQK